MSRTVGVYLRLGDWRGSYAANKGDRLCEDHDDATGARDTKRAWSQANGAKDSLHRGFGLLNLATRRSMDFGRHRVKLPH